MDKGFVMTTGAVRPPGPTPLATCTCAEPIPEVRATRKGAARTHCSRCGLPLHLDFAAR